jgi:hypothetical protein
MDGSSSILFFHFVFFPGLFLLLHHALRFIVGEDVGTSRVARTIPVSSPRLTSPTDVICRLVASVRGIHTSLPVPEESAFSLLKLGVRTQAPSTITFSAQVFLLIQHESFCPSLPVVHTHISYDGLRFTHRVLSVESVLFWMPLRRISFS